MILQIKQVIAWLEEPAGHLDKTVDGLKSGNDNIAVTGIAAAFMASHAVIQQAVSLGVNLLITHEGMFYSHQHQEPEEFAFHDPVYTAKQKLVNESGLTVYRMHDHIHRYRPDGIMAGLVRELGWEPYIVNHQPAWAIAEVPPTPLMGLAEHIKSSLGIPYLRAVGGKSMLCSRIGLLAGYRGGGSQAIPLFEREQLDLIIAGEGPEWETPEYVRDACFQGSSKALLLLGHAQSEEPGMKLLADRLREQFPEIPVYFLAGEHDFQIL